MSTTNEIIETSQSEAEKIKIDIFSPEVVFQMGKKAAKHKKKGYVESEEERQERKAVLTYCFAMISLFPQTPNLNLEEVKIWLEKAYYENPEKAFWHVFRARGIGGSDMGVLYAATEGDQGQSPFGTNREIVMSKLFMTPIGEDNIHTSRGTRMEGYIQDIFLKDLSDGSVVEYTLSDEEKADQMNNPETNPLYGAKSILDEEMQKKFVAYINENHPWLVGNPDDIIMKANGDIVIVDYKAPVQPHGGKFPDYYLAQVHHYGIIFKELFPELADRVKTVGLAEFNFREGSVVDFTEVPYNDDIVDKIFKVGDTYWNDYVLKGLMPKSIELGNYTDLEDVNLQLVQRDAEGNIVSVKEIDFEKDLEEGIITEDMKSYIDDGVKLDLGGVRKTLVNLTEKYATIRQLSRETDRVSEDMAFMMKRMISNKVFIDDETDILRSPTTNISFIKKYDMPKLMKDLIPYLKKLNLSDEMLNKEIYENPRAYLKNDYSPDGFIAATDEMINKMAIIANYELSEKEKSPEEKEAYENAKNIVFQSLKYNRNAKRVNLFDIPQFAESIDFSKNELDVKYLISFVKRVDPSNGFPFRNYIDYNNSDFTVRLRMAREDKDIKAVSEIRKELAEFSLNLADEVGDKYSLMRREAITIDKSNKEAADIAEAERKAKEKEEARIAKEEAKLLEAQRKAEEKQKAKMGDTSKLNDSDMQELADLANEDTKKSTQKRTRTLKK